MFSRPLSAVFLKGQLALPGAVFVFVFLICGVLPDAGFAQDTDADFAREARLFVEQKSNAIIESLNDPALAQEEKAKRVHQILMPILSRRLPRLILGPAWREITADEQTRFSELFLEWSSLAMSQLLSTLSEVEIEVLSVRPGKRIAEVSVAAATADGPPSLLDFKIIREDESLALLDVSIDDISPVLAQRAEVAAVIDAQGVKGLLELMQNRLEKSRSGAG